MMVGLVLSVIMALCESLWHMCRRGRFPLNWKTRRRATNSVSDLDTFVEVDRKKNGHIQMVTTIRIPGVDKRVFIFTSQFQRRAANTASDMRRRQKNTNFFTSSQLAED
ncbi:uncharacterized protein LOC118404808 isoform X1 [Branchiostoma floridae]|uniref:Uncharacterized protein LOC118404808 isoform X1 n=1 Tax=Branchiostoma floridae TaxID=7739 RepID=A0A9J7HI36_BRAFL|nr:uncharacterized protein LOC118404808 isoform X1 [Branchiostoma floridae]